jgi:hypothetical protein
MRRYLVPLAAAALLALVAPAPAHAVPYPAGTPNLTASPGTVTVGGTVTVTGSGFAPGDPVTISVTYTPTALGPRGAGAMVPVAYAIPLRLASKWSRPDANGDFTATETLTQVGTATITATSASGLTASTSVLVLAGGPADDRLQHELPAGGAGRLGGRGRRRAVPGARPVPAPHSGRIVRVILSIPSRAVRRVDEGAVQAPPIQAKLASLNSQLSKGEWS